MKFLRSKEAREYLTQTLTEVKRNYVLIGQLLLLSIAAFIPHIVGYRGEFVGLPKTSIFFAAGLFLVGLIHRTTFFILCLLIVPVSLVIVLVKYKWGLTQIDSRMEAYIESTPNEIMDYLRSQIDALDMAFVGISFIYLAFLIVVTFYRHGDLKFFRNRAVFALTIWLAIFFAFGLEPYVIHSEPIELIAAARQTNERYEQLAGRLAFIQDNRLEERNCNTRYDKIVIVIGESASPDHMSAFGYAKATTPFADHSSAYRFRALAPSNQTRYSLAMMLTAATPGHFEKFYRGHSLVSQLRRCGYHTLWISNQGRIGKHDSFSTSLAKEAHENVFLNNLSWRDATRDGEILTELEKRGVYQLKNHVTFIHLMGSHPDYRNRYPADFGSTNISDMVDAYDNSLLYTDTILAELYQNFEDESLLFVYVSDHGEVVSNDRFGHGFDPGGFKEEFRTPLLIWTDDSVALNQVNAAIGNAKQNLESFGELIHFLVGISERLTISTSDSVSVLSPENVVSYQDLDSFGDQSVNDGKLITPVSKTDQ